MEQTQLKAQKHIMIVFLLIYLLNCSDLLFTYTYLKTGIFVEYNPIMRLLLSSPYLTILIKLIAPAALVIYFFFRLGEHTEQSMKLCQYGGGFLILVYTLLNGIHLYYLFHFLLFSS